MHFHDTSPARQSQSTSLSDPSVVPARTLSAVFTGARTAARPGTFSRSLASQRAGAIRSHARPAQPHRRVARGGRAASSSSGTWWYLGTATGSASARWSRASQRQDVRVSATVPGGGDRRVAGGDVHTGPKTVPLGDVRRSWTRTLRSGWRQTGCPTRTGDCGGFLGNGGAAGRLRRGNSS